MKQNADWLRDLSTATAGISENLPVLERIARALEMIAGTALPTAPAWTDPAYIWDTRQKGLCPAPHFEPIGLELLLGIEHQAQILEKNTRQFAADRPANNALLWGARGTGKSSLVKAVFQKVRQEGIQSLHLIEIHKEDLDDLISLTTILAEHTDRKFIIFLDDLSFETSDDRYKNLKSALEGGVTGQSRNILIYATSNRRHLLPRTAEENATLHLHPAETAEENISLSDRFGLWLGFYACDQATYLRMVATYAETFNIPVNAHDLKKLALEWSMTRGARSGRVAWQFIKDLAGQHEKPLKK
jgi:predicted AAA+ superfamily ATPase